MQKEVSILKGQTFADIAIQETGWMEGLYDLADTNELSMTEVLVAGSTVQVNPDDVNQQEYRSVSKDNVVPATAFGYVLGEEVEQANEGIGYWGLEIDFIVQ